MSSVGASANVSLGDSKPKRGRKSKKDLISSIVFFDAHAQPPSNIDINPTNPDADASTAIAKDSVKKRGRKPKGGKIITELQKPDAPALSKPNIILHLKCNLTDITASMPGSSSQQVSGFDIKGCQISYDVLNSSASMDEYSVEQSTHKKTSDETAIQDIAGPSDYSKHKKRVYKKIKELEHMLHTDTAPDTKSACFWCTCAFEGAPIYIPKCCINGIYHMYGCFCTPECGVAHLINEHIDVSAKFERYHLMNFLYKKAYDYDKNIKPAPDPHYMLDKFCGNLTIEEYRALFEDDRLFLISDKPMTRIFPELHEDTNDFILNRKIIQSNAYKIKPQSGNKFAQNKADIINDTFNV